MTRDSNSHFGRDGTERRRQRMEVHWSELVAGLEGLDPDGDHEIQVRREAIPIIVVPGLFGTRLCTRHGEPVWDPCATVLPSAPNGESMASALLSLGVVWTSPAERARLLLGTRLDPDHLTVMEPHEERGWRCLTADVHGEVLRRLDRWQWDDGIRLCFDLPVYGFGYNWADDIGRSGQRLAGYITQVLQQHADLDCRRVILVTHGVGGLVASAACALHGAGPAVLGVFGGAQPLRGMPALYHALKAGLSGAAGSLEEVAAATLGHTGRHTSALLGRMPGLLQALPGETYTDGTGSRRWLRFTAADGTCLAALPDEPRSLDFSGGQYWSVEGLGDGPDRPVAEGHSNSYHALGRGLATADTATYRLAPRGRKRQFGRLKLVPVGPCDAETVLGLQGPSSSVHGKARFAASITLGDGATVEVTLQPPDGDGDGWVPSSSARPVSLLTEPHGRTPRCREFEGAAHFELFNHGPVLEYLVSSIEQMCTDYINEEVAGGRDR